MKVPRLNPAWPVALLLGMFALMGSSPPEKEPFPGGMGPGMGQAGQRVSAGQKVRGGGGKGKQSSTATGNLFLQYGGFRAASNSFRKQLEKQPDSAAAHVGLGKALARMGMCAEALEHFAPYVGTVPFTMEVALSASTCANRLGLLWDAIYYDQIAIDLNPDSIRALTSLALNLSAAGDEIGAEEVLERLLLLREDRDASAYARASLALRAGNLDEFDIVIATWEREDRPALDFRRLQAQAWLDLDNPLGVEQVLGHVARMRGGDQVRFLRAEAQRRLGYSDEATLHLASRPQSVLEGVDSDAVRVRIHADEGEFTKAHELLAQYDGLSDPDILASAWYLAAAEGHRAELPALEAAYERSQASPLRQLSHLVPWTARKD